MLDWFDFVEALMDPNTNVETRAASMAEALLRELEASGMDQILLEWHQDHPDNCELLRPFEGTEIARLAVWTLRWLLGLWIARTSCWELCH